MTQLSTLEIGAIYFINSFTSKPRSKHRPSPIDVPKLRINPRLAPTSEDNNRDGCKLLHRRKPVQFLELRPKSK